MTITGFDRETCKRLTADLEAALQQFAAERGLSLLSRGGTFDPPLSFTAKIEFRITATADGRSADQARFERDCGLVGLTAADFGRTFMFAGQTYIVADLNVGRAKPLIATRDGKRYAFSIEGLRLRGLFGATK